MVVDLGNILIEMGQALTAKPYPRDSAEFAVRNVLLVAILAGAQACHKMAEPETPWTLLRMGGLNECPVAAGTPIEIMLRDKTIVRTMEPHNFRWDWRTGMASSDVVAYRKPPDDDGAEWIEHDGVTSPPNVPVIAQRRDGTLVREIGAINAGPNQTRWYWKWAKERSDIDVVKYRIVKPEQVG